MFCRPPRYVCDQKLHLYNFINWFCTFLLYFIFVAILLVVSKAYLILGPCFHVLCAASFHFNSNATFFDFSSFFRKMSEELEDFFQFDGADEAEEVNDPIEDGDGKGTCVVSVDSGILNRNIFI